MRRRLLPLLFIALAAPLGAQGLIRPHLDWRTFETTHFRVHHPAEMAAWTRGFAERLESIHEIVSAQVGFAPTRRIDVIVEDPASQSNGSAFPNLRAPAIVVWPTPPEPGEALASGAGWDRLLATHEYAHLAHLARPSRNSRERIFSALLPASVGPLARKLPRWVTEGYATYIEGRIVGGRPHGTVRPAVLRQWALEGRLPTYGQLSGTAGFSGGAMAYLAGSAFLEWLARRNGDSSVVHLWRRLSARQQRSFETAFSGVYGAPPDELYGQFSVEVMARALESRRRLDSAGLVEGDLVQRRRWSTGAPALSRGGALTAIALGSPGTPARIVVWRTVEPIDTAGERRARERLLALDPEDVPAVRAEPRPKRAVATLRPLRGVAFESPRFFADSSRLLVSHLDPLGDGAYRHDLYEWTHGTGALRRITYGAAVRDADPSPDGRTAVGVRCLGGICDLVRVELATGEVSLVLAGSADAPFHRPRFAPDGRSVVVGVHRDERWRLALTTIDGEPLRPLDLPGTGDRYDAAFTPDGRAIICVSDDGGIANLERIDLGSLAATTLTSVTGAVFAPEPSAGDGSIFYLQLHARGLDLRRLAIPARAPRVALGVALEPVAAARSFTAATLAGEAVRPSRPYGAGPRAIRLLPGGQTAADGTMALLAVSGTDPIGRLGWLLQGGLGARSAWRGGSLVATWRRFRPEIEGSLFHGEHRPTRQRSPSPATSSLDIDYTGAAASVSLWQDRGSAQQRVRAGGSLGRVRLVDASVRDRRALAFVEYRAAARVRGAPLTTDVLLATHASAGETGSARWQRGLASGSVTVRRGALNGRVDGTYGIVRGDPSAFEQIALGGASSPFVEGSLMTQRLAMPALPFAVRSGREAATVRLSSAIGPLRAYWWAGAAGETFDRWHRVIGAEREIAFGGISLLRLPTVAVRGGVGYSLDEPVRREARLYASVTLRP